MIFKFSKAKLTIASLRSYSWGDLVRNAAAHMIELGCVLEIAASVGGKKKSTLRYTYIDFICV